jgi:putative membrane protein
MKLIIKIGLTTLAVVAIASILKGISVADYTVALLVAIVLGLLNNLLRPVLILLTIPVTILTLGLFLFVINAGMVLLCDRLVDGFTVTNFWWALAFSLLLSIAQSILYSAFGLKKDKRVKIEQ